MIQQINVDKNVPSFSLFSSFSVSSVAVSLSSMLFSCADVIESCASETPTQSNKSIFWAANIFIAMIFIVQVEFCTVWGNTEPHDAVK